MEPTMKTRQARTVILSIAAVAAACALALPACEKKGPLEKAGEKADKAIEKTGDAIKDVTK